MAVGPVQLLACRSAGRPDSQRIRSRSLRMQNDHDDFHGMDDGDDFHPRFCTLLTYFSVGRGDVWCLMGGFPGRFRSRI